MQWICIFTLFVGPVGEFARNISILLFTKQSHKCFLMCLRLKLRLAGSMPLHNATANTPQSKPLLCWVTDCTCKIISSDVVLSRDAICIFVNIFIPVYYCHKCSQHWVPLLQYCLHTASGRNQVVKFEPIYFERHQIDLQCPG